MAGNKYTHLVLFDIDGTLVHCGATPRRVFKQALLEVFGTAGPIDNWIFDGKTDPMIVQELMDAAGVPCSKEMTERALTHYSSALQTELPKAPDKKIYPGVREAFGGAGQTAGFAGSADREHQARSPGQTGIPGPVAAYFRSGPLPTTRPSGRSWRTLRCRGLLSRRDRNSPANRS